MKIKRLLVPVVVLVLFVPWLACSFVAAVSGQVERLFDAVIDWCDSN